MIITMNDNEDVCGGSIPTFLLYIVCTRTLYACTHAQVWFMQCNAVVLYLSPTVHIVHGYGYTA